MTEYEARPGKHTARHRQGARPAIEPAPGVPTPRNADELRRYGPNLTEAAIRVQAESVQANVAREKDRWRRGFTRRRVIAGAGAVGVAAFGTQLVTSKYAFADPASTNRTMVVVFMRGGMDGLSIIVPAGDANLKKARPNIVVPDAALLPGDARFGLHPALAPLHPFWQAGQMAAVHAVASPDVSRSHFQAQDCLERGTATTAVHTGWLDRALTALGPGTTFRAVAEADATPRSLVGGESKLVLDGIEQFALSAPNNSVRDKTMAALEALYTGFEHPAVDHAMTTLKALNQARQIASQRYTPVKAYPGGGFGDRLKDVARLIKAKVGLRLATIDLGGWDMHTGLGNVNGGDMRNSLNGLANALSAFATDLGPDLDNVTLVTMTEFGRRVNENGNAGTDHGHGSLMMLLGGGLNGGAVHGKWPGLAPGALDNGDLAGANDYRDVLGEVLDRGFGVADVKKVFPDHEYNRIGVLR
jgi:uncharacterized protein (DUF1501 family)